MRRVILVAPEFPPSNTAGAHRPRLFAKHLPACGWTPTVLTIRADQIEGPLDPDLESLVDPKLEVVRTGALPIRPVRLVGDLGIRTLPAHARALAVLARRRRPDAIVLFGPPWFTFALGPLVHRWYGIPYIVDYIDPWISAWSASHRFPQKGWFHHRAAAAIEPAVLGGASHVTAVSRQILTDLQARYQWLTSDRLSSMPYGAEPDDFDAAERLNIQPPDFSSGAGEVTIAFTGALQPTGRELVSAVLRAVADLRSSGSDIGRRLRIRFYGTSNLTWGHGRQAVVPLAREHGIEDIVSEIPERIPYLQALSVLRACDVVLVMGSVDRYYHASKLYPAIVAGRPILALCQSESSIGQVMADTGGGTTICFDRVADLEHRTADIARAIEMLARRPKHAANPAVVERFTARASTAVLAGALDRISPPEGGHHASVRSVPLEPEVAISLKADTTR